MKKSLLNLAGALLLALAVSNVASATPIQGSIGFVGTFTTDNNSDFTAATSISFPGAITLGGTSGTYASIPNFIPVTFFGFTFVPATVPFNLWSLTSGLNTYSFQATSLVVTATNNSLVLQGSGIASATGYTSTNGSWIVTANGSGANFTFSSGTSVPDGGTTALLLGLSLVSLSLAAFRRKSA